MSANFNGTIGFLDFAADSANVKWLCVLFSSTQAVPELKVERFAKGKLDAKVKLTLAQNGASGVLALGSNGSVNLVATGAPVTSGALFVWSCTLDARAGGPDVSYVMSAREGQADFVEQARISATSFQRPDLNTGSPVNLLLKEAPVPRLAVGINQAVPRDPPPSYKGFSPGPLDASTALVNIRALQALLYRIYVILDTPGTFDPMWDQQSLSLTVDSLSDARFETDKIRVAEELWARQVTEMLAFTPYGGPSAEYGGGCTDLELIMTGIKAGATSPRYGIWYGCQHLANFGVFSRGLQEPLVNATFPSGILLEASARCVDTVMQMTGGIWLDSTVPPQVRTAAPAGDPGLLSNGGLSPDITTVITGTFPAQGKTFKYQPGSVHLFSNRPARKDNPIGYRTAIQNINDGKSQAKATICTIVTVAAGDRAAKNPPVAKPSSTPGTGPIITPGTPSRERELCVHVQGLSHTHEEADIITTKTGKFVGHNVAAPIPPHLGFALRTRKTRVQFFDTGGFNVTQVVGGGQRSNGVTAVPPNQLFHGGNYDDPLGNQIHGAQPFRGTGIFSPVTDADAQKMRDHVLNVLRKARPLGLAKFVLLRRNAAVEATGILKSLVVYSSPILNMYDAADESNYAISRYMWSLRALPGAANATAVWLIYSPLRDLAAAMRDAARTQTAVSTATQLFGKVPPQGTQLHDFIVTRINPAAQIVSQTDGTVRAFIASKEQPHASQLLIQRKDLLLDQAFQATSGIPTYLNG